MAITMTEDYGSPAGVTIRVISVSSGSGKKASPQVEIGGRTVGAAEAQALVDVLIAAIARSSMLTACVNKAAGI